MFREQVSDGWDPVAEGNRAGYGIPATTATAASGGNRELLLGPRPARRERCEVAAGSRNPYSLAHETTRPPLKTYYYIIRR